MRVSLKLIEMGLQYGFLISEYPASGGNNELE